MDDVDRMRKRTRLKRFALTGAMLGIAALYGEMRFIAGFDAGSDTTLCLAISVANHTEAVDPSCARVPVKGPSMKALRLYRKMTGDEVQFDG